MATEVPTMQEEWGVVVTAGGHCLMASTPLTFAEATRLYEVVKADSGEQVQIVSVEALRDWKRSMFRPHVVGRS